MSALATTLAGLPLHDPGEAVSTVVFYALAALAILAAILAAVAPRIVHAAFGLMAAFFGVAGLYALLGADFVALAQVLVYVGGILVLLVFGVLLTARASERVGLRGPGRTWPAVLIGGVLFFGLMVSIQGTDWEVVSAAGDPAPTTAAIGRAFLEPTEYLVPFELASVLLLAALVGAAYLARRQRTP